MLDFTQLEPERRRPITRAEYFAMGEAGLFDQERVELLDGVIEVSYSSLRFDRTAKASIYARAGVPAYWIVNATDRSVEEYSEPASGKYAQVRTYRGADRLVIPGFPDVTFSVDDVFA